MTKKTLRILYIDDYPLDRALVRDALVAAWEDVELVEAASRDDFNELLPVGNFDLVLSDFNILGFTGLHVLEAVQKRLPGTPVIIVTGTGSEEIAAEAIKRGAADYVIKSPQHIRRLPHTIETALAQKNLREERVRAEMALRESQRMLSTLMGNLPGMVYRCLNNTKWTMLFVSEGCLDLTGYRPQALVGDLQISYSDLIHPDDRQRVWEHVQAAAVEKRPFEIVYRLITASGAERWVWSKGSSIEIAPSQPMVVEGFITDISELKRAEQSLQRNAHELQTVFDTVPIPLMVFDSGQQLRRLNHAAEELSGLKEAEALEKSIGEVLGCAYRFDSPQGCNFGPSCEMCEIRATVAETLETRQQISGVEAQYHINVRKKTQSLTIRFSTGYFESYEKGHIVIALEDITEMKRAEQELQRRGDELQMLTIRVAETEEAERRRLARELHDQVGQSLAVLAFNLNILKGENIQNISDDSLAHLEASIGMVSEITQGIRSVMDDLRPSILDDYGLFAAISWYADRYRTQTGIPVRVMGATLEPRLPITVENAFFRIVQESLTNITRHAEATQIEIKLLDGDSEILLSIADNGVGFIMPSASGAVERRGWGVVNMRERADSVGARLMIDSQKGHGTTIRVARAKETA